ncbi:DUF3885 domain-containing protein [Streptomyces sannanensis]|uniref:DUF3885 domain-containing protein n=1 Tax=Streptomyces sannanensis TaxID=285536 RepID=UPI003CD0565A
MTPSDNRGTLSLDAAWESNWPGTLPLGHLLRSAWPDRWVRFHSLPESKRYADTEAEFKRPVRFPPGGALCRDRPHRGGACRPCSGDRSRCS